MLPLMALMLTGGCQGMLWPFENPEDSYRCDPDCASGEVCKDGECVHHDGDGPRKKDGGGSDNNVTNQLDCTKNLCHEYVINGIFVPLTSSDAQKYALSNKGKKYNALGNILALLSQQAPSNQFQESTNLSVCVGKTLILLKVQATNLTNDNAILGQTYNGKEKTCCTSQTDEKMCCSEANTNCFNGTSLFERKTNIAASNVASGKISNGMLLLSPLKTMVRFMTHCGYTIDVDMQHVTISGTISANKVSNGVLTGTVSVTDMQTKIVPALATMLSGTLQDPKADKQTKDMIKQLFDTNSDGKITTSEVAENALIKTFLAGDVDVNNDGTKELSIGFGITAVKAKIKSN